VTPYDDESNHSSDESVILDDINQDFTSNIDCLKGSEYPPKVREYIKTSLLIAPNDSVDLNDLSATKTGFTTQENFKDFEYKKENLLELMEKHNQQKEYKATTKGKFIDHIAQDPATNYFKDIGWIHSANPEAA
jgi:hypothetical protein